MCHISTFFVVRKLLPNDNSLNLPIQKVKIMAMSIIRREEIRKSKLYKSLNVITKVMDKYMLDPVIGLVPGVGDFVASVFVIPFLYVSIFQVRSVPLTLALLFNVLKDIAMGLIPFWIGYVLDFFNKSYQQNMRLIMGFVEGNEETIRKVNKDAVWMGAWIVILCLVIYGLVLLAMSMFNWGLEAWIGAVDWLKNIWANVGN